MPRKNRKRDDPWSKVRTASALTDERPTGAAITSDIGEIYMLAAGADSGRPNPGAWAIQRDAPVAPLVFLEAIQIAGPTEPEFQAFWKLAGRSPEYISEMWGLDDERSDFQSAIHALVLEAAIPGLKTHWKALAKHLKVLIRAGRKFRQLAAPALALDDSIVLVPAAVSVCASLLSSPQSATDLKTASKAVGLSLTHYERALLGLKPILSKRGPKGDPVLFRLAKALIPLAGKNLALPTNESLEKGRSCHPTALLKLMRAVLNVAVREGNAAIKKSPLTGAAKKAAIDRLKALGAKSDSTLIDHLRLAKQVLALV